MSSVSPSTQKVNDFLSNISQLSQDRLRENQKTRRDLQADIDALRSAQTSPQGPPNGPEFPHRDASWPEVGSGDFGISQLTFNRHGDGGWGQKTPQMAPPLPTRPAALPHTQPSAQTSAGTRLDNRLGMQSESWSPAPALPTRPRMPDAPLSSEPVQNTDVSMKPIKPMKPMKPPKPKVFERSPAPANVAAAPRDGSDAPQSAAESVPGLRPRPSTHDSTFPGLIRPVASRDPSMSASRARSSLDTTTALKATKNPGFSGAVVAEPPLNRGNRETPPKMATFTDLENRIRARGIPGVAESQPLASAAANPENPQNSPVRAPSKGPSKPWAPALKPAQPVKPIKPNLKTFETKETEFLRDHIKRLSPTKTSQYQRQDRLQIINIPRATNPTKPQANLLKPLKPVEPLKPSKPKTLVHEPEAVLALGNLRKSPVKKHEPPAVPEALQRFQAFQTLKNSKPVSSKPPVPRKTSTSIKSWDSDTKTASSAPTTAAPEQKVASSSNNGAISGPHSDPPSTSSSSSPPTLSSPSSSSSSSSSSSKPAKPDFHAHLANILRSSTEPSLAGSAIPLPRTFPETGPTKTSSDQKLTHPNKSRSKGPRRKLPKSQTSSGSNAPSEAVSTSKTLVARGGSENTSISQKPSSTVSNEGTTKAADTTETTGGTKGANVAKSYKTMAAEPLVYTKPRRAPPPKAKKPSFEIKPSRSFSGDVFI
ncbi:hypothetical protein JCM33374_g6267 [Metschnikowia sp. JCM 33374]|nr:hypothetical protein JCM33374_g6267 [Metschnikowia sp. JCM 33374]